MAWASPRISVGVLGRAAEVAAPGGGRPPEPAAGSGLFQAPAPGLLVAVIAAADRAGLAQARPAALVMRDAVLVIRLMRGRPAGRERAGSVQDPGQVTQRPARIVPPGLMPVVTRT